MSQARDQHGHLSHAWKAKFGGLDVSQARRLKGLEDENAKLKRLLAEAMLDSEASQDDGPGDRHPLKRAERGSGKNG